MGIQVPPYRYRPRATGITAGVLRYSRPQDAGMRLATATIAATVPSYSCAEGASSRPGASGIPAGAGGARKTTADAPSFDAERRTGPTKPDSSTGPFRLTASPMQVPDTPASRSLRSPGDVSRASAT